MLHVDSEAGGGSGPETLNQSWRGEGVCMAEKETQGHPKTKKYWPESKERDDEKDAEMG